jgi:NADPH2:quinone reductase
VFFVVDLIGCRLKIRLAPEPLPPCLVMATVVVIDLGCGPVSAQSLHCLAPFGRSIVYGMASREPLHLDLETILAFLYDPALNQSVRVFNLGLWFGMRPEAAVSTLRELVGFIAASQVKVPVDQVLPLAQAAAAHRLIEERRTTGKIILKPWAE